MWTNNFNSSGKMCKRNITNAKYGTHQIAIKHGRLAIRLLMTKNPAACTRKIRCPPITPRISCIRATFIANLGVYRHDFAQGYCTRASFCTMFRSRQANEQITRIARYHVQLDCQVEERSVRCAFPLHYLLFLNYDQAPFVRL